MEGKLPLDLKTKVSKVMTALTGFTPSRGSLSIALTELVKGYDSPEFARYRTRFTDVALMPVGAKAGTRGSNNENQFYKYWFELGTNMDALRAYEKILKDKVLLSPSQKQELEMLVGFIYSDLRIMAEHEEELNIAYRS